MKSLTIRAPFQGFVIPVLSVTSLRNSHVCILCWKEIWAQKVSLVNMVQQIFKMNVTRSAPSFFYVSIAVSSFAILLLCLLIKFSKVVRAVWKGGVARWA